MAKWIQKAIKRPGALKAKAKRAGMGVQAYAHAHSKGSSRTARQSRLAITLKRISRRR